MSGGWGAGTLTLVYVLCVFAAGCVDAWRPVLNATLGDVVSYAPVAAQIGMCVSGGLFAVAFTINRLIFRFLPLDANGEDSVPLYTFVPSLNHGASNVHDTVLARTYNTPLHWVYYAAGFASGFHVLMSLSVGQSTGFGRYYLLLLTGKLFFAVPCDHYGWFGVTPRRVTLSRIFALFLVLAGLVLYARAVMEKEARRTREASADRKSNTSSSSNEAEDTSSFDSATQMKS